MSYIPVEYPADKTAFYVMLKQQLRLYIGDETDKTAVLGNFASILKTAFKDVNWAGFYLVQGDELVLGPFQGNPAVCRIGLGEGVCGAAWESKSSQVVGEISCFAGHIACDCNTRSEIVIPLFKSDGSIWGVLDMDSVVPSAFDEEDRAALEDCVTLLNFE